MIGTMNPGAPIVEDAESKARSWLLAACTRPEARPEVAAGDRGELEIEAVQHALLRMAIDHRVVGLTVRLLERLEINGTDGIAEAARRIRLRSAVLDNRLDRAIRALVEVDADPVLLKGATIAERFYPSPDLRDQADIDVLVPRGRVDDSLRAMEALGYRFPGDSDRLDGFRRFHFHVPLRHSDGHMIELHWELQRPDARFRLAAATVRERATHLQESPRAGARHPCPDDVVLHLVLQNLQEGFSRLSRIVDVERIVSQTHGFDWHRLVRTSRAGDLSTSTAVTLQIARQLLDAPIPGEVIRALRPDRLARHHISLMAPTSSLVSQRFLHTFAARQLLELWLMPAWSDRVGSIWSILAEDPEDEILWERRVGPWTRWVRLSKLGLLQIAYYGNALGPLFSRRKRAQMRFWSSHAINSDFL